MQATDRLLPIPEANQSGSPTTPAKRLVRMDDGTFAEVVAVVNIDGSSVSAGGASADRELVVSTYRCKTAFTGASQGDTITATQVIDVSGATPTTVSTIWRNQSTSNDLASAPSSVNLELVGSAALTDAQLRASPVAVTQDWSTGAGVVDAKTQRVVLASDGPTVTAIGAQANAAAAADGTGDYSIIAALKRGLLNWAALLGRIPALVAGRVPVMSSIPAVTSGTILSLTTSTTGTTYTAFASQACTSLDIVNNTGTTIEYRRGGAGTAMQIPDGAARMVIGITNANQIDVRRTDTSNTPVSIQAEAFVS